MATRIIVLFSFFFATLGQLGQEVGAFVTPQPRAPFCPSSALFSKKQHEEHKTVPVGSFVEFEEKKRVHAGKIESIEHKSNGNVRYIVIDNEGNKFDVSDKEVHFDLPCPNSPGAAAKLFDSFVKVQQASVEELENKLEVTHDLLEIAWEEAEDEILTPNSFIELVHAHAASAIEKYMAWRLLQSETAHIFFKEIKDHGHVVSFKARARKAVEAAKHAFCMKNEDQDLCFV